MGVSRALRSNRLRQLDYPSPNSAGIESPATGASSKGRAGNLCQLGPQDSEARVPTLPFKSKTKNRRLQARPPKALTSAHHVCQPAADERCGLRQPGEHEPMMGLALLENQ